MSGSIGFHSPLARGIINTAFAVENLHRRLMRLPRLTGQVVITVNRVGYVTIPRAIRGRLGGADLDVRLQTEDGAQALASRPREALDPVA
jgi:hypothetical protein